MKFLHVFSVAALSGFVTATNHTNDTSTAAPPTTTVAPTTTQPPSGGSAGCTANCTTTATAAQVYITFRMGMEISVAECSTVLNEFNATTKTATGNLTKLVDATGKGISEGVGGDGSGVTSDGLTVGCHAHRRGLDSDGRRRLAENVEIASDWKIDATALGLSAQAVASAIQDEATFKTAVTASIASNPNAGTYGGDVTIESITGLAAEGATITDPTTVAPAGAGTSGANSVTMGLASLVASLLFVVLQ